MERVADNIIHNLYVNSESSRLQAIAMRIDFFSQQFLEKPYLSGAQGEGATGEFDQSPLYRFDQFDCVTYVNNILALSFSNNLIEFKKNLLKLNYYHAEPIYQNRFHFMSVDWNPQNQQNGFLKDITTQIKNISGNSIAEFAEGDIDRPSWFLHRNEKDIKLLQPISADQMKKQVQRLRNLSRVVKKELVRLPYLPLTHLFGTDHRPREDIFTQIPHGSIIEIVRPNWNLKEKIGTHLHVSHMGFLIWEKRNLFFRHASSDNKRVESVLFTHYLQRYLSSDIVKGIHIQMVIS